MTRWKITQLKNFCSARKTKLFTAIGDSLALRVITKVPTSVLTVARYVLDVSIVIAGALFQDDFLSAVDGLDGQPAVTAAALAAACLALVAEATVVVVEPGVD